VAVRSSDVGKCSVLPQLIHVSKLNIRESLFEVVVIQGVKEEALVVGKIICPIIHTPVAVTEENELGGIVQGNLGS
jgi:hypothetical protein